MFARRALPLTVSAALVLACSDSSGPNAGLSLSQLAGTWELTDFRLLLESDTTVQQDLMAGLGLTATLVITRAGSATLTVAAPGQEPQTASGTIVVRSDTLEYTSAGSSLEFRARLDGRRMTWLALYTDEFADLTGDGVADETREAYGWLRR